MKRFNILLVFLVLFIACKQQDKQGNNAEKSEIALQYTAVGQAIDDSGVKNAMEMAVIYDDLVVLDTLTTKFTATVAEVCQAKGCWMKLQLKDGQETMVRFKDYGFFVPKDIAGKEVIVNGLAFVEEMSVEDQQHFAKDAGKTEGEIASISETKKTYGFEADGVLIAQ